jgi:putative transposase
MMVNLSDFGHWLTLTHTQRWHAHYRDVGTGHLYQGRFKSFPIEQDEHFLQVCRYVERNPLRAGLVNRAEQWRWSSLWQRSSGNSCRSGC